MDENFEHMPKKIGINELMCKDVTSPVFVVTIYK